jgi:hypothetical protein
MAAAETLPSPAAVCPSLDFSLISQTFIKSKT